MRKKPMSKPELVMHIITLASHNDRIGEMEPAGFWLSDAREAQLNRIPFVTLQHLAVALGSTAVKPSGYFMPTRKIT
jgi:hypothetical protein